MMQYQNVCLEAVSYTLPDETVTSEEIERRLEPLYRRLRLAGGPAGADDRNSRAAVLGGRRLAQRQEHRQRRIGDRRRGHRSDERSGP